MYWCIVDTVMKEISFEKCREIDCVAAQITRLMNEKSIPEYSTAMMRYNIYAVKKKEIPFKKYAKYKIVS